MFRLIRRVVGLVVLAALLGALAVAGRVWWVGQQDDRRRSDAIVVLGASQFDGRPSAVLRARLEHARDLYQAGVAPRVITVGGSRPGDRFTEAASGRAFLVDEGVPEKRVVAVERGSDTLTSVIAVAAVMAERGWDTAVVVTDPWHSLRAREMARDAGIDAVTSPARNGPAYDAAASARYVARESAAYVYYELVGGGR
jgi:uncharacterized SAM-binding protein YcdF (DUF218 family)